MRRSKHGQSNITVGDLAKWCIDYEPISDESMPDESLIVRFTMFFNDDQVYTDADDYTEGDLCRLFITTRRLLIFCVNIKKIAI